MFQSSYRNTCEKLGELEKAVARVATVTSSAGADIALDFSSATGP